MGLECLGERLARESGAETGPLLADLQHVERK